MQKRLIPLATALSLLTPLTALTTTTHASAGTCGAEVECYNMPDLQPSAPDDGWITYRATNPRNGYYLEP